MRHSSSSDICPWFFPFLSSLLGTFSMVQVAARVWRGALQSGLRPRAGLASIRPAAQSIAAVAYPASISTRFFTTTRPNQIEIPEIPFEQVHVRDPETGSLTPLQPLERVLRSIDESVECAYLVSTDPPVVRIRTIASLIAQEKEKLAIEEARKRLVSADKEVQVSWNAADGDLAMKVRQARQLIEKGDKVNIIFARKAGGKKSIVKPERMQEILEMFNAALADIATKCKADDVRPKITTSYWEPIASVRSAAAMEATKHSQSNKSDRDAKKEARRKKDEERRLASEAKRQAILQEQQRQ